MEGFCFDQKLLCARQIQVVVIVSAVTAYKEKAKAAKPADDETPARPDAADEAGDDEFDWRGTQPGIGLWIVVNAKNSHCHDMEEIIKQLFLAAGFEFQFTYKARRTSIFNLSFKNIITYYAPYHTIGINSK